MKVNAGHKREPFSEPLKPLGKSRNRMELEEIRLEAEAVEATVAERVEQAPRPSGFSALPVDQSAPEPPLSEITEPAPPAKVKAAGWKFWKRPSKREQQLAALRQGCDEMVGLMQSMKTTLEQSQQERIGVKASLSPLPVAVASLRTLSKTQEKTGEILEELKTCVEQSAARETRVADSLGTFNDTMASVGRTFVGLEKRSDRSIDALQKLTQRVEESDRMFNELYQRLRESEYEFAEQLGRASQRGAFAAVSACALLSLAIIFITVTMNQERHAARIANLPSPRALAAEQAVAEDVGKPGDAEEIPPAGE